MNTTFPPFRTGLAILGAALLMLSACAEREVILPGEREDIRAITLHPSQFGEPVENTSRAIRLPAQISNRNWEQSFGSAVNRVAHPALRASPQLIWSTTIGKGNSRRQRITADPVVGGGLIYTLDSEALVSGVNTAGVVVWNTDLTPGTDKNTDATGGGMAYAAGTLYVSSGFGSVTALDAKTGTVRWRQKLESTGSGTPLVRGNLLYLVAGDQTGWAIDIKTGRVAWRVDAAPSVANVLGAPSPAMAGELVVFAFGSGDIVASFRSGGLRRWGNNVSGRRVGRARSRIGDITGSPVVVGKTIYVGNHSGRTVALNADSGERLWTAREGALDPVWPVGGSLFLVSETGHLVRLDAANGDTIWAVGLPGNVKDKPRKRGPSYAQYGPILAGGRLVVPSDDGFIRFFAPEDGRLAAQVEIPGGASSGPVVASGILYVMGANGELHAFR